MSSLELLKPSVADVRRAEELERDDRVQAGNNQASINAYTVSALIKNAPPLAHNRGANKFFGGLEERERQRRLGDRSEIELARSNALALSKLVSSSWSSLSYPHVIPQNKGTNAFLARLEEQERSRRLNDQAEASVRRARAQRISEGMRVSAPTLKARLIKRNKPLPTVAAQKGAAVLDAAYQSLPSKEQVIHTANIVADSALAAADKAYEALPTREQVIHTANIVADSAKATADKAYEALPSREQVIHTANIVADSAKATADKAYEALPTKEQVTNAANTAGAVANAVGHVVADAASDAANTASHFLSDVLHKVSSLTESAVHSVQHAVYGDEEIHDSLLGNVKSLEEQERHRRMVTDKTGPARGNARKLSLLMVHARFPRLSGSKGRNLYLNSIVERERTRRLANRDEADIRQINAKRVSRTLTSLGWPFIRDAKYGKSQAFTQLNGLEEDERGRRMVDDFSNFTTRYNAGKVASLIKDHFYQADPRIIWKYITKLEDKERAWRQANSGLLQHNAHRESRLIVNIGHPFYRQGTFRLSQVLSLQKQVALEKLHEEEENERAYRMNLQKMRQDQLSAGRQAKTAKLAKMLSGPRDDNFLSLQKQQRISHDRSQDVSRFIGYDTNLLEEKERKSRLADKYTAHVSRSNAHKVSGMIKANQKKQALTQAQPIALQPAHSIGVHTQQPQLTTQPTARPTAARRSSAVTIDIAPSPPVFRAPSISSQARPSRPAPLAAAPIQPTPIFSSAPAPAPLISAPISAAPLSAAPISAAPLSAAPISAAPFSAAPISAPISAAPLSAPLSAPISAAPLSAPLSAPISAAPFSAAPLSAAPLSSAPLSAPIRAAPLSSAPLSAAPLSSAPISAAPLISAPLRAAPITQQPTPTIAPTAAPSNVLPVAATFPVTTIPTTPVVATTRSVVPPPTTMGGSTYATSSAAPVPPEMHQKLIDHARKMYEQEINLAERQNGKAAAIRGKNSKFSNFRVNRHTHSAEKHMANATRHQQWLASQGVSVAPQAAPVRAQMSAM